MNVWVITVGEPLPLDDQRGERLLRSGILCRMMATQGHTVCWWTSTFNHMARRHVFDRNQVVALAPNYEIRLLHGGGYEGNVSPRRLVDHWRLAKEFRREAAELPEPDIILCSFPTIELSAEAVRYGQSHGVPVVLDVRDLWPDTFVELVPKSLAWLARAALFPYFVMTNTAFRSADAVLAINDPFVDWGLRQARRSRSAHDRAFPLAYPATPPTANQIEAATAFWRERNIVQNDGTFTLMFAGTIGRQFDFTAIVEAATTMRGKPVRFVICGTGEMFDKLRAETKDLPNVLLPGWVGAAEIWTLMRLSQAGLAPYLAGESFLYSLPNKSLEYLSAGLPVISSLPGALERLLAERNCGITFPLGDAAALRRAIEDLIAHPHKRQEMSRNASETFERFFRAEAVYPSMINHLERISDEAKISSGA